MWSRLSFSNCVKSQIRLRRAESREDIDNRLARSIKLIVSNSMSLKLIEISNLCKPDAACNLLTRERAGDLELNSLIH